MISEHEKRYEKEDKTVNEGGVRTKRMIWGARGRKEYISA